MDAVGKILAEREHGDLPWGMGASLAVLLHTGVAAILVISALHRPTHFVQPRAVAVRLVQAGTLKGGPGLHKVGRPVERRDHEDRRHACMQKDRQRGSHSPRKVAVLSLCEDLAYGVHNSQLT